MNPVEKWINSDNDLRKLLIEIEHSKKSLSGKAEEAFERLSEHYSLPKMPSDLSEEDAEDKRSFFEEHALIKYLSDDNEDPRGIVISAAYHILNDIKVDMRQVAQKEFGRNIPERYQIAIRGNGYNGEVVFPQKLDKSWGELGCVIMKQLI